MKEIESLVIPGKFLDEHIMGELEDRIWNWLEELGVLQGDMADRKLSLKIVLIQEASP